MPALINQIVLPNAAIPEIEKLLGVSLAPANNFQVTMLLRADGMIECCVMHDNDSDPSALEWTA